VARLVLINGAPASGKSRLAQMYIDEHPLTLPTASPDAHATLRRPGTATLKRCSTAAAALASCSR